MIYLFLSVYLCYIYNNFTHYYLSYVIVIILISVPFTTNFADGVTKGESTMAPLMGLNRYATPSPFSLPTHSPLLIHTAASEVFNVYRIMTVREGKVVLSERDGHKVHIDSIISPCSVKLMCHYVMPFCVNIYCLFLLLF